MTQTLANIILNLLEHIPSGIGDFFKYVILKISRAVREFLSRTFPNRWIGRKCDNEWLLRSPDLTQLDFFFLGNSKKYGEATNSQPINDYENGMALIAKIQNAW